MSSRVVVVGSVNMDLVARVERMPLPGETVHGLGFATLPGGKGANQAVAAARLGGDVAMVGRVGSDAFGAALVEGLRSAGADVAKVTTVPGASGCAVIHVDRAGQNAITVVAGANAALRPEDIDAEMLAGAAVVLLQLETPLETVERVASLAAELGVPVLLDPAPARPLPAALLQNVTWLTPNETECEVLLQLGLKPFSDGAEDSGLKAASPPGSSTSPAADQAGTHLRRKERGEGGAQGSSLNEQAERLLALGPRNVVLKLGGRGVFLAGVDVPQPVRVPAFTVEAVDTTAAGDAWNGGFAFALARGDVPSEAARFACAVAALSVTRAGAQGSMPSLDDVHALLRQAS